MEHPEEHCDRCGRSNPVWWTPAEIWRTVEIDYGFNGVLCPSCFIDDAELVGVTAPSGTFGWLVTPKYDDQTGVLMETQKGRIFKEMKCYSCKVVWLETFPKGHTLYGVCPNCGGENE